MGVDIDALIGGAERSDSVREADSASAAGPVDAQHSGAFRQPFSASLLGGMRVSL